MGREREREREEEEEEEEEDREELVPKGRCIFRSSKQ